MPKNHLNLAEIIFITIMATAIGILWWAYSLIYDICAPLLKVVNLNGLIEGIWQIAGVFFAVVIRKPGSAVLGAMVAAIIEGLISQWGFSALISGICQGLPVEIVFLVSGYRYFPASLCALSGAFAAVGGFVVSFWWYAYSAYSLSFNLVYLSTTMLSGAVLGGLAAYYLANKMAASGVLNQFKISQDYYAKSNLSA